MVLDGYPSTHFTTIMIIISGADIRFQKIVKTWKEKIVSFGYRCQVYDLGNLGFGKKGYEETNVNFITQGFYNSIGGHWKSTGLWKPRVILDALNSTDDHIVYLDADAYLLKPIAINFKEFDIGVVERQPCPDKDPTKVLLRGKYNAGVIFFSNNDKVKSFVIEWGKATKKIGNDQAALSFLLERCSLRVKVFHYVYNMNTIQRDTFIFHETGNKKQGVKVRI